MSSCSPLTVNTTTALISWPQLSATARTTMRVGSALVMVVRCLGSALEMTKITTAVTASMLVWLGTTVTAKTMLKAGTAQVLKVTGPAGVIGTTTNAPSIELRQNLL